MRFVFVNILEVRRVSTSILLSNIKYMINKIYQTTVLNRKISIILNTRLKVKVFYFSNFLNESKYAKLK